MVEHNLAKVRVASSSLVFRSKVSRNADLNFAKTRRGTIICRSSITMVGFFSLFELHEDESAFELSSECILSEICCGVAEDACEAEVVTFEYCGSVAKVCV